MDTHTHTPHTHTHTNLDCVCPFWLPFKPTPKRGTNSKKHNPLLVSRSKSKCPVLGMLFGL